MALPISRQPLTPSQTDIWLQQTSHPDSVQFNISLTYRLPFALDVACFVQAVDWVFAHNDALYARLVADDATVPELLFDPVNAPRCEVLDFSSQANPSQTTQVWLDQRTRKPFRMLEGSLTRAALIKVGENSFCFACEFFHLVVDGSGSSFVFTQVARAYANIRSGRQPAMETGSFAAYLDQQRTPHPGSARAGSVAFWETMLATAMPVLPPTQTLATGDNDLSAECIWFSLPRQLVDRLTQQATASNATFFHILILATAHLLAKHYGLEAPPLDLPMLNRDKTHKESVGFFVETRPLPIPLDESATLAENIQAIARRTRELFRHYRVPASTLTRLYHAAGHTGTPAGLAALSYITSEYGARIEDRLIPMINRTPVEQSAPFLFYVFDGSPSRDVHIEFSYRKSHADPFMARLFSRRLLHLLAGMAREPEAVLGNLDLLPADERRQITARLHRETEYVAAPRLVIDDILTRTAQHPDAIAVETGTARLTYGECMARAQTIARVLDEQHGIRPGDSVALLLPRGGDLVASELASMLTGGTYTAIDPQVPVYRARQIIEDAGAKCLLTVSALQEKARAMHDQVVAVDTVPTRAEPFASRATPEQVAYLIYTSGSTGRPKGVEITHRTLADHCASWLRTFPLRESGERALHFFSPAFDASVETIFPSLLRGNTIVAAPHPQWSVYEFPREIVERRITVMFLPPAYLLELLKHLRDEPHALAGHQVRVCMAGGDVLHAESAPMFGTAFGTGAVLINVYGPTETTVTATTFQVPADYRAGPGQSIPIGRPHAGRGLRIVDSRGRDVPFGTEGELLIGGVGLARSYRNLPEETATRFVTLEDGSRYYRSGDVVHLRPDGMLTFRHRLDRQVQIRGFRIEPSEIESCLHTHSAVNECAVEVRSDTNGQSTDLRAFVSLLPGTTADPRALREHLQERLPDYMVPTITLLERLPKNNSGKIDRQALQALNIAGLPEGGHDHTAVAPQGPVEELLALLWGRALETPATDIHGDFFEQGGHSLLAAKLVADINRTFRVELPIDRFFSSPSIASIACELEPLVGSKTRMIKIAQVRLELAALSPEQIRERLAQTRRSS